MLPLLITWQWGWWEAWVYAGVSILGFVISRYLAGQRHPDLLAERGRFLRNENPEPWDKILSPLMGFGSAIIPLTAGLDMRFGPSAQFGLLIKILVIIFMMGGYILGAYALITNRFFSGMVRIQIDRGHHVITSGPYRWVRHPGYAGAILAYVATPFLLDSLWSLIPVFLGLVVLAIRTRLKTRLSKNSLMGIRLTLKMCHTG